MLSETVARHLERTANLYGRIVPGRALTGAEGRVGVEAELFAEITTARGALRQAATTIVRPRPVSVFSGEPKGAWAHVYYVSFHDPVNSTSPTEGFYPVFLISTDQRLCWLSVLLAAAGVGITGRGGWSQRRGQQLRSRAESLGAQLEERQGWRKGPIELGAGGSWLHRQPGNDRSAGRAYECGAIVSKAFDPRSPPADLAKWLEEAFRYFDTIYEREALYLAACLPRQTPPSSRDQAAAAITGKLAEEKFLTWVVLNRPEWGQPRDVTDRVGLGYDVEFPAVGLRVEVKGCRRGLEDIRLTDREWEVARASGPNYVLCLVTGLDEPDGPQFAMIVDPFVVFRDAAVCQSRLQITYTLPRGILKTAPKMP